MVALPKGEIPDISAVTGFHSARDKANQLEIRVLESDGSADVARNPVTLFLVVTDDPPGGDAQERVWRLPQGVSEVKKVTATGGGLKITAVVNGQMDERTGRFPRQNQIISIIYDFTKGVLSDKLRVTTSPFQ